MREQAVWALVAAVGAFVLGGLTSLAQSVLPGAVAPLANSVSGWVLLTVLLLWWLRTRVWVTVVLGAVCLVLLPVGYAMVSTARGFFYNPLLWVAVGIVAGPFVGSAVAWARQRAVPRTAAVGFGFLAGIALGDATSGFLRVRDTTGWFYWVAVAVGALAWLVVVGVRRLRTGRDRALLLATAATITAVVVGGLGVLSALL